MDIQLLDILKWIGIALAAGFIGYFGRCLAVLMLEKVRRRKEQASAVEATEQTEISQSNRIEESRLKLEKKKAKQAVKAAKKARGK